MGETGTVTSALVGGNNAAGGIFFSQGGNALSNAGQITSLFAVGVRMEGMENSVVNTGTIIGRTNGIVFDLTGASFGAGESNYVTNSGTIAVTGIDSSIESLRPAEGAIAADRRVEIVNTAEGEIVANGSTHAGIALYAGFSEEANGGSSIVNAGTITSSGWWGIDLIHSGSAGAIEITNTGLISGGEGAIAGGAGAETVTNLGTILGDIDLGAGNDVYDGSGGIVVGAVSAGDGQDRLSGGAIADDFDGGNGNDVLRGYGGDDTLVGGTGNDRLLGGTGDDAFQGGGGADTLGGGVGDDVLSGGNGNDVLRGNVGDDLLIGGIGQDTFVFRRGWDADEIADFQDDKDTLVLSGFGFEDPLDALAFAEDTMAGVVFDFGGGDTLLVVGATIAGLSDDILV